MLPFQNLSGDEKQDYLADVITDQLTTYGARSFGKGFVGDRTEHGDDLQEQGSRP